MIPIRLLWTPYPHRGGFCMLDDTDGASLESVKIVYEHLDSIGLCTTKTVWAFEPREASGIPPLPGPVAGGVTLETPAYREYCAELARRGNEIALHGASAGNNRRERTLAALGVLEREFGAPGHTYVCHAKNAENPYWQQRAVAAGPLRWMMNALASRYRCSGEDPASPYFWGDVCRARVRFMRLFRTARINTLAANPSMPYHEREKPWVRGWFTSTERGLDECTTPEALASLGFENGLCLVRQHLSRFANPRTGRVHDSFKHAMRRLRGAPDLWIGTVSAVLGRLQNIHGVALAYRDSNLWIVNTNDESVEGLQIFMGERPRPQPQDHSIEIAHQDGIAAIKHLPPRSITYFDCSAPLLIAGRNAVELDDAFRGRLDLGHGTCWLNLGHAPWFAAGKTIAAGGFDLTFEPGCEEVRAMSRASEAELTRLFLGHAALLVRRVAREGDSVDLRPSSTRPHLELVESNR
jgi:hypothetical protein